MAYKMYGLLIITIAYHCVTSFPAIDNTFAAKFDIQNFTFNTITPIPISVPKIELSPCICGVFMSGQFTKGSKDQPKGHPAMIQESDEIFACNSIGQKQCLNRCLDGIVKHLPNSASIVCGSIDRDCFKERAHLFIKNCGLNWSNTNLSAGREYCCKSGETYTCPIA